MKTLKNSFKLFIWAIKNPDVIKPSVFKLLSNLLGLILDVSYKNRPFMTHIAYIHPEEGEKAIVSIWAGAGIDSSPTRRIDELLRENKKLKKK